MSPSADTREPSKSSRARGRRGDASYLRGLVALVLIVGILYLAKPVIVPLALAVLLSFVLSPLVVAVQRWGLKRVPAVLLVVLLTLAGFAAVSWGVGTQLVKLANDLPSHKTQIREKVTRLRGKGTGTWSRIVDTFREATQDAPAEAAAAAAATRPAAPVATAATASGSPPASSFERLLSVAGVVLEPVASTGLVLILVIFLLIRREDLRNRVIGLLGRGRLTGTTRVLVGSAERVSRLLFMQLCVNVGFGAAFGLGLLLIGVPYWFLWAFLTALLRFVPYVGSWMAAALPIVLSLAISPGWTQPLLALGAFVVLDVVTANAIEPMLFGASTGVSPVALLIAAVFWTWVWGPIGLVLSTPMTVCLVVLGQHVPKLKFLSLLLGDQPALSPSARYYQRLLAGDAEEARALAREHVAANGLAALPDTVLVPALLLTRRDRDRAGLTADDEAFIVDSTEQVIGDFVRPESDGGDAVRGTVLGCPSHHKTEELIVRMLGAAMAQSGVRVESTSTRTLPAEIETRIERERPAVLFVAVLPPGGVTQARYLCRRLRRRFADLPIVVGYFGRVRDFDRLLVRLRAAGASYVTTSVAQTSTQILALLPAVDADAASTPEPLAANH